MAGRRHAMGLLAALTLLATSSSCARREQGPHSPGAPLVLAETNEEPEVWHEQAPSKASAPEPATLGPVEAAEAEPEPSSSPLAIDLVPEAGFLRRPLPAADPGRYARWRQVGRIKVGKSHLSVAMTSVDESYLIVHSSAEGTVRIYERASRKLIGNYKVEGFAPGKFARGTVTRWPGTEHGPAFLVGNTRGLTLYSMLDGRRIGQLHDAQAWDMRWSADGRHLVAKSSDISTQTSVLNFYRRTEGGGLALLRQVATKERVDELALSRDATRMVTANYPSDTVELFDLRTGRSLWRVAAPRYASSVDISPDGRFVAVGGEAVVVFDIDDPTRTSRYTKFGNNVHKVRFSPSGDALAASSYDGHVRILSAKATGRPLKLKKDLRHSGTANVYAVTFLADGGGLITSSGDKTVRVWGR